MKNTGYHIMRVAMGITFLWIGVLIFRDPEFWGGFLQPWALNLLPQSLEVTMIEIAILDIVIGVLFLIDSFVWVAGLLGALHMVIVLTVSGIDAITVRDIGLLGGCLALFWSDLPEFVCRKFKKQQH